MKQLRQTADVKAVQEPIGIVISNGATAEPSPRFVAFVWGPAPEPASEMPESRAA